MSATPGSQRICDALLAAGVECVFGLPGTQNVPLFEALRTSRLRTVVATHELSAAMMANGYYRGSGKLAALATIPGPGFTWAMTGIAEASLDSAALVHLVGQPATGPGRAFQLQAIDQAAIAGPLVRAVHRIDSAADAEGAIARACADAVSQEPGPVLVHIARPALGGSGAQGEARPPATPPAPDPGLVAEAATKLAAAPRIVIFAGQGCQHVADKLARLAERLAAPVVTTTSARGVLPEDHALSLGFELAGNGAATLNELVAASDAVLAIGCKFSHNGSRGFALEIAPEKLIHVDAAAHVLGANYPARIAVHGEAGAFIDALLARLGAASDTKRGFAPEALARIRERARHETIGDMVEPKIHGVASGKPADFFAALRAAMPRESVLVTDSGLHQMLARAHFRVLCPRGLIVPTNLQSMGFGIGAAIGAAIGDPSRPVVALVGDGGLTMSGLEIATAVREKLRLVVIVFVDGAYGLIRFQQLAGTGRTFATDLVPPDIAALADAVGARHVRVEGDAEAVLREAVAADAVTVVEVAVGDSLPMHWMRAKSLARSVAGKRARSWLRRLLGRR
jgi:acetolactate synthase I/II/III large subunit